MAVEVGSAVGYLDLDISGFMASLKKANEEAGATAQKMEKTLSEKFKSAGENISKVGGTLTKTVTLPIVGLGTASIKTVADFESAMSKVSAISGATGSDLQNLTDKAKEMGAKTKFSASESAEAFQYMAMAGWKTEDMIDGIDGIMALAAADGLDLATTSDIVTDALTAFGLKAEDSSHFADVLAKASSSANTNVSMLGESFKYVAPVAGALGYSVEDTAVALGLMANAGIKGSQGGTALRSSLTKLANPTGEAAKLMEKYGIEITNTDGSMKSLGDVMDILRTSLGGLSESEQAVAASTIFGQEAMSGMLAIINASSKDFDSLTESIYNSEGAAQKMADTQLDNLSGQITILKSTLEGLAIQFGEIILPYVKEFVEWIQNLAQKFGELSPQQQEMIVKFAAIAAIIGPIVLIIGKLASGVGSVIGLVSKFGGVAATAATPIDSAGKSTKRMAAAAKNLVAAGAGILLAATGMALLAQSAIALADAGLPAVGCMILMVGAMAALGAGALYLTKTTASVRGLSKASTGLLAMGASIILVATGFAILAQSSIALAEAGWPAIAVMGGLVGAIALLAAGAAAIGPALTAGAVGLVAFGGAVALIGVGVLAASAGITLLAGQLPIIAEYGAQAAGGILALSGAMAAFGAGVIVAGAGILVLSTELVVLGAAFAVIGGAAIVAAAGVALLATAMKSTATSVKSIEKSANSSAKSLESMVKSVSVVEAGLNGLESIVGDAVNAIKNAFTNEAPSAVENGMSKMSSAVDSGMANVNSSIRSGFASAISYIRSVASQSYTWGADIIQGLANGIRSRMNTLRSAVNQAANIIYSNLHFSRPDEGPLRNYETWMPDFMEGLAKGIHDNSYLVKSAVQDVASDMKLDDVESAKTELFTNSDTEKLNTYNVTLVNTIGLYKQLIEQMRMCAQYSGIMSGDNNLLNSVITRVEERVSEKPADNNGNEESKKPDTLTIPISIGEEQIENVVVDLLRREVRV